MSHLIRFVSFRTFASPRRPIGCFTRQHGAAALLIVLVLLIALTLIVFAMGRVGVQEQTISGNENRTYKASNAALAGLEHGFAWLADEFAGSDKEFLKHGGCACWPQVLDPTIDPSLTMTPGTGETYDVRVIITPAGADSYTPYTPAPGGCAATCAGSPTTVLGPYIQVVSVATDTNDNSVTSTVQQYAVMTEKGTVEYDGSPPLVINGCFTFSTTGTPDVVAQPPSGDALLAGTTALNTNECLAQNPTYTTPPEGMCICPDDPSYTGPDPHIDLHGGNVVSVAPDALDVSDSNAAWNTIFSITKDEFKRRAAGEAAQMNSTPPGMKIQERTFIYIDPVDGEDPATFGTGNTTTHWTVDMGCGVEPGNATNPKPCGEPGNPGYTPPVIAYDPSCGEGHPVYIYFGPNAGCLKMNGSPTIWGIVYVEDCAGAGEGFGDGTVYGAAAAESDMDKLNSNFAVCSLDLSGGSTAGPPDRHLARVPGTFTIP